MTAVMIYIGNVYANVTTIMKQKGATRRVMVKELS